MLRLRNESEETRRQRLELQRIRQNLILENESVDSYNSRLNAQTLRLQNESDETRRQRLEEQRIRQNVIRENESSNMHYSRLDQNKEVKRSKKHRKNEDDNDDYKFYDNFEKETKNCKCYYNHNKFVNSHKNNNWEAAINSEIFGFQRMKGYQSLELYWNKKCEECLAMYLDGETSAFMKKCCGSFKAHGMQSVPYGLSDLPPLLPSIKKAINDNPIHMSKYAQTYNNLLSFGAVGVDNKRGGGFEKGFKGPHAATINGHTYHKTHSQSSSNPSSGLGYIFFDNLQKLSENGEKLDNVKQDILQSIYEDMKSKNAIAQEVLNLGTN
jgi:hypothetical protein